MPTILSVTDFSAVNNAAVHYSAALASQMGCDLHILHSYTLPVSIGDPLVPLATLDAMDDIAAERMDALLPEVQTFFPALRITRQISYGDWRDIVSEDEAAGYDLIVTGSDADNGSWLGSDVQDAAVDFGKPVLVVPQGSSYKNIQSICLACDAASMQHPDALQSLRPILAITGARLILLHINTGGGDKAVWNNEAIAASLLGIEYSCHETPAAASGIDAAIHDFALSAGADWLAIIHHHYSFFAGLFHKSHTRAAFRSGDLPVLSLE